MALADFLQLPQTSFPDGSGIMQALAANALKPTPPSPAVPVQQPSGVHRFLNSIGDALLVANGLPPVHRQRMMQQQQQSALSGFLTNPDQAIAALMQIDAPTGIDLYKAVHPASELPLEVKLLEFQKSHPEDAAGLSKIITDLHPGIMAPVTMEAGATVQTPGASGPAPGQIVGGYRFKGGHPNDPSSWEPANSGGATASTPSLPFR